MYPSYFGYFPTLETEVTDFPPGHDFSCITTLSYLPFSGDFFRQENVLRWPPRPVFPCLKRKFPVPQDK